MKYIFSKIKSFFRLPFKVFRKVIFNNSYSYVVFSKIFSSILYIYILILKCTCRIQIHFPQEYVNIPAIFSFWHGRMVMTVLARNKINKVSILLSQGKDAELIAGLMKKLNINTVRGSASRNRNNKGGASSLKCMIDLLVKYKEPVAIASDGPIGPLMRIMPGVAMLALTTNVPVIPVALTAKFNLTLNTWDKFVIPLPFSKILINIGEAISPYDINNQKKSLETYRQEIEIALIKLTQKLDKKLKQPMLTPSNRDKKNRIFKGGKE